MKNPIYLVALFILLPLLFTNCGQAELSPEAEKPSFDTNIPHPDSVIPVDKTAHSDQAKKKQKVEICHRTGNGSYKIIEVSENAVKAHMAHGDQSLLYYHQGFEDNTDGWFDINNGWYGEATRVSSGTNGITSSKGSEHAIFEGDNISAPFSRFGGYLDTWPGTWAAEIDIYLDPNWALSQGFDYSVAATGADGNHRRDFIFHVNHDASTGGLLVAGSNNTNFAPREDLENINHYVVTSAGWYTFQHLFYDDGGVLAVDLNLLDSNGNILFTETRKDNSDVIGIIGGNRYGWFTFLNVDNGIAVDEHELLGTCAL